MALKSLRFLPLDSSKSFLVILTVTSQEERPRPKESKDVGIPAPILANPLSRQEATKDNNGTWQYDAWGTNAATFF